jgi:hypothetical protein
MCEGACLEPRDSGNFFRQFTTSGDLVGPAPLPQLFPSPDICIIVRLLAVPEMVSLAFILEFSLEVWHGLFSLIRTPGGWNCFVRRIRGLR